MTELEFDRQWHFDVNRYGPMTANRAFRILEDRMDATENRDGDHHGDGIHDVSAMTGLEAKDYADPYQAVKTGWEEYQWPGMKRRMAALCFTGAVIFALVSLAYGPHNLIPLGICVFCCSLGSLCQSVK